MYGTGADLQIKHDGSNSYISNNTGALYVQQLADDSDIVFQSDDGSGGVTEYFRLDGSSTYNIFSKDLYLIDNVILRVGTGNDLRIFHDGSGSKVENYTGNLTIQQRADDSDIVFQCDDGSGGITDYLRLDGSTPTVVFSKSSIHTDNIGAYFGTGLDLQIFHDGTDSKIENGTGDLYIRNNTDDKDIIFRCDDGSGGLATYFKLDGSFADSTFRYTVWADNSIVALGANADLSIYHNATNSIISNSTGNLTIQNTSDDSDIIFKSDDGSGGVTEYFRLDGGTEQNVVSKNMRFEDSVQCQFGAGTDLRIYHNGSDSYVQQTGTGDLIIENTTDDKDIAFKCDDGSGGIETYINIDGSARATKFQRPTFYTDSISAKFGTDGDMLVYHSGSTGYIENHTGHFQLIQQVDDHDIIFKSDDGSSGTTEYFRLDGGTTSMVASKNITFVDNIRATFGSGSDMQIYHNSTSGNGIIENNTGDLVIQNNLDDKDVIFKSDNGSGGIIEYLRLDGSDERLTVNAPNGMLFFDNIKAKFGTGSDVEIFHNGTHSFITNGTGDLTIANYADDRSIYFQSDDGGGNTANYIQIDGANVRTLFSVNAEFSDNVKAKFGDSDDLQIFHDGSNSRINEIGTGNLIIQSTNFQLLKDDGGEFIMQGISDAEVSLYYNGSKKFETTNTGALVTGDLEIANSSDGIILESPNGTRFRITVDNSGNLSTTSL
jgi:hypothetical protein